MALEAVDISLAIGGKAILSQVSLAAADGCITALVGPNGAGKTTLLRALAGEGIVGRGSTRLNGKDITDYSLKELARARSVMTQSTEIAFDFSVLEILQMAWMSGSRENFLSALEKIAEDLGVVPFLERSFRSLSGGEKQRILFARAVLQITANSSGRRGRFVLLDEPTASLDVAHELQLLNCCADLASQGIGFLVVLHDLNLAAKFADHIVLLDRGRCVRTGTPAEVLVPDLLSEIYKTRIHVEKHPKIQKLLVYT
jgi:iron complex transport system ATP-binding protein